MKYTLVGQLPRHQYVLVDTRFTHRGPLQSDFNPAVWFGLVSYPGRVWGCTVLLENGAVYRNLPPHALLLQTDRPEAPIHDWTAPEAQTWDCYGEGFTTLEYDFLSGLECLARCGPKREEHLGVYLFTAAPVGDAYSAEPEQAKEFHFIALRNRRLTIQTTDRVVFKDRSFTGDGPLKFPSGLATQTDVWSAERFR